MTSSVSPEQMVSSLRFRIAIFAFALAATPILVLGVFSTQRSQSHLVRQSLELQRALAERVQVEVQSHLERRIDTLRVLERVAILPRLDTTAQRARLERLLVHEHAFHEIALATADGVVARVSRSASGTPTALATSSIAAGFERKSLFVGAPRFDAQLREPLIDVVLPVVDRRSGDIVLVLAAVVRLKPVWDLLASLDLPAETDAYLVDADGQILAHKSPSIVLAGLNLDTDVLSGRGASALTVKQPLTLDGADASVAVVRSTSAALRLATETRDLMVLATFIAVCIAAALGVLVARGISRPVEQLADVAADIAGGNFDVSTSRTGPAEVRTLGVALEAMAARLSAQFQRLEAAEFAAQELAHVTLESIGDAVISTDQSGLIIYMNPVAEHLTGWRAKDAEGQPMTTVFHIINEHTREPAPDPVARAIAEGKIQGLANHTVLISKDGQEYAIQDSAAPIVGKDGKMQGAVMVFSDVTEARAMEHRITHQATHDSLTNLVNRQEFEFRLRRVLETTRGSAARHALCYLDLDQFKIINDTCGHAAGDELLRQVALLFSRQVRNRDTLARIGGDEFTVLMEHCDIEHAKRLAEQLRQCVDEFRFAWDERLFSIGVSIGVVEIDRYSQSFEVVLQAADNACYLAKEGGRNRIHVYRHDDQAVTQRREEMQWVTLLTRALEEDRFELHAQAIVPLGIDIEAHAEHKELLLRMIDSDGTRILPSVFMRAAERYNLMVAIDRWVVAHALAWIASADATPSTLWGINLSGQSLGDEHFLDYVLTCFDESGAHGDQVCFEVTETAAIGNLARATTFIHAVRRRGCKLALDDFGSGLSSFAYLKTLPVDFLKIDGVFVKDVVEDDLDFAMVRSINEIGHILGMRTIAEFVESNEILERIRGLGIDAAQGRAVGVPEPLVVPTHAQL